MSEPNHQWIETLKAWVDKMALELVFAEPGRDQGLLPVNNFLDQMEELASGSPVPETIRDALKAARQGVNRVFETTGHFSEEILAALRQWVEWMQKSLAAQTSGQPLSPWTIEIGGGQPELRPPAQPAEEQPPDNDSETVELKVEEDGTLLREFIHESREHLEDIEQGILTLESNPGDLDTLNSIFRAFHTFKGSSGFLGLQPIHELAHELESLLHLARQRELTWSSRTTDLVLRGADVLRNFLVEIEPQVLGQSAPRPVQVPTALLLADLRGLMAAGTTSVGQAGDKADADPTSDVAAGEEVVEHETATSDGPSEVSYTPGSSRGLAVKVDPQKLDNLVDLVGEMVVAQSLVAQEATEIEDQRLARHLAHLGRITNELQRTAMSLRMVPIRSTFQKMARLTRDLAVREGKMVRLVTGGEETELDRTLVEEVAHPIIHMIRNAIDHGIERPEVRRTAGKPPTGTIHLRAFHQSGHVVIQIEDDGAGLNHEKIVARAVARGLVAPGASLSEGKIFDLISAPGFSTADRVSDLSGRGVGMDVVRRNIERLRGKVEVRSEHGRGSQFTIYLPLTLAIIDGLIVRVGPERFIVPTLSVKESFRPSAASLSTLHERGEMIQVRGRLLPLIRLDELFGFPRTADETTRGIALVVQSGTAERCLFVDHLLGKQEIVIKSLGETFKDHPLLAGAAILGDGRVGLILDVDALIHSKSQRAANAA